MIQKKFLSLLLVLLSLAIGAQSPGYQGKKTVVGYGFYFNPAFAAAIADYGSKIFNTQHEFFIERALKRGLSIGFSAKLYRSTYNNTGEVDLSEVIGNNSLNGYNTLRDPSGSIDIKGRNYALYFKLYRSGYVAPWGRYFLFGLTLNTRECTYNPDEMQVGYSVYDYTHSYAIPATYSDFGMTVQTFKYPDLMIGSGNSRILWDKIVLDYGYNVNVLAFAAMVVDAFDEYTPYADKYIQTNTGMRVRGINRFNFFVKVGYLF